MKGKKMNIPFKIPHYSSQKGNVMSKVVGVMGALTISTLTVNQVVDSTLVEKAAEAASKWEEAQQQESNLAKGDYISEIVDKYTNGIKRNTTIEDTNTTKDF